MARYQLTDVLHPGLTLLQTAIPTHKRRADTSVYLVVLDKHRTLPLRCVCILCSGAAQLIVGRLNIQSWASMLV